MNTITVYCASAVYPHPYTGPKEIVEVPRGQALPARTSRCLPEHCAGHWPCLGPEGWRQVEDHRGSIGWVNGKETVITELGPLPQGWDWNPPTVGEVCTVFPRFGADVAEAI